MVENHLTKGGKLSGLIS